MEITAALATDLAMLTEALDETGVDIAQTLHQLTADAKLAVRSFLGLSVIAGDGAAPVTFTALQDSALPQDIRSSLMMPLTNHHPHRVVVDLVVILYAARPGAFVDLAADLSWLTDHELTDFALDEHLHLPATQPSDGSVLSLSVVNQAVGVLLGRGYTPELADLEIDAHAGAEGHSRFEAAQKILEGASRTDPDPTPV